MFHDTVTVFNYHESTRTWYPSVLYGGSMYTTKASNNTTQGTQNGDYVNLLLHGVTVDKIVNTSAGSKKYRPPKEYASCSNPAESITFRPECDFFYVGVFGDLSPQNEDSLEESFYHIMNNKYDGVYMIQSAQFFSLLPHFEIQGR